MGLGQLGPVEGDLQASMASLSTSSVPSTTT
jgi:hypothetical protein